MPTSSARLVEDQLDELRDILECYVDFLSDEAFFDGEKQAKGAARRGISLNTSDNQ